MPDTNKQSGKTPSREAGRLELWAQELGSVEKIVRSIEANEVQEEIYAELLDQALQIDRFHNQFSTNLRTLRKDVAEKIIITAYVQSPNFVLGQPPLPVVDTSVDILPSPIVLSASGLFPVARFSSKNLRYVEGQIIASQKNAQISYSGPELSFGDQDVFLELISMTKKSVGATIETSMASLVKGLGKTHGKAQVDAIWGALRRLRNALIWVHDAIGTDNERVFALNLVDEIEQQGTRGKILFRMSPQIVRLFQNNQYVLLDKKVRNRLKIMLAKKIYDYLKTEKKAFQVVRFATFMPLTGNVDINSSASIRNFKQDVRDALKELCSIGYLKEAWLSTPPYGRGIETKFLVLIDKNDYAQKPIDPYWHREPGERIFKENNEIKSVKTPLEKTLI